MTYILTKPSNVVLTMAGTTSRIQAQPGLRGVLIAKHTRKSRVVLRYLGDPDATLEVDVIVFGKYWRQEGGGA